MTAPKVVKAALPQIRSASRNLSFAAGGEHDLSSLEGVFVRLRAAGGDVFISAGEPGDVVTPLASGNGVGFVVPDGEERDVFIEERMGRTRWRTVGGTLTVVAT